MPSATALKVRKTLRRSGTARAFELEAASVARAKLSRLVAAIREVCTVEYRDGEGNIRGAQAR